MESPSGVHRSPTRGRRLGPMKTQDPHSELADGFEVAPLPPIGPDGAPQIPSQAASPPSRPTLCQAGPCRNYHRLVTQVDAATPGAVRLPIALPEGTPGATATEQGTLYRARPTFHVQVHHYCYPSPGIEMPLGALPVVDCNRWEPSVPGMDLSVVLSPRSSREAFWRSDEGRQFRAQIENWERRQATMAAEDAEAEALIAKSMSIAPQIACQICGRKFEESALDVQMRCAGCRATPLLPRQPLEKTP